MKTAKQLAFAIMNELYVLFTYFSTPVDREKRLSIDTVRVCPLCNGTNCVERCWIYTRAGQSSFPSTYEIRRRLHERQAIEALLAISDVSLTAPGQHERAHASYSPELFENCSVELVQRPRFPPVPHRRDCTDLSPLLDEFTRRHPIPSTRTPQEFLRHLEGHANAGIFSGQALFQNLLRRQPAIVVINLMSRNLFLTQYCLIFQFDIF
jgi:hypothetical protein